MTLAQLLQYHPATYCTVLSITQGIMYRTAVIIRKKSLQDESRFVLSGLIFLIMPTILCIIPLITRLLANTKKYLKQCVFLQFICYHS